MTFSAVGDAHHPTIRLVSVRFVTLPSAMSTLARIPRNTSKYWVPIPRPTPNESATSSRCTPDAPTVGPGDRLYYSFKSNGLYGVAPFYRKDSERFTATLADPITTAPAVGTNETYTFSDAATAPLMAGLEVTIDSEVMRILTVSAGPPGGGSSVKLYRGSNGTTPAPHAAGVVSVSGRRPLAIGRMHGGVESADAILQPDRAAD